MIFLNKFFKNNYNLRKSLYILGVVLLSILFYRLTENIKISSFIPIIFKVLSPFIYGAIMAYLLNIGTRFLEKRVFVKFKYFNTNNPNIKKRERILSISIAFVVLIGIIIGIISYIIPEIMSSIQNIINIAIGFDYTGIKKWVDNFLIQNNITLGSETYNSLIASINKITESFTDWLKYLPDMIWSLVTHTISFASSIVNVIMGLIIAFYLLMDKEKVVDFGKIVISCISPKKLTPVIIDNVKIVNETFNSFFAGKTLDSFIIGLIFFFGGMILNIPYLLLASIIIAITNMIPYFGPFIGAVPVIILTMLVSPIKSIWVLIFIFVLQQFDGMILGPKILGNSIGLKPIGVIFAIIVGGAIAGPLGMFFGVPIFACLFNLLFNFIHNSYNKKYNIEEDTTIDKSKER